MVKGEFHISEKIEIQFYFISDVCLMDQKNLKFLFFAK